MRRESGGEDWHGDEASPRESRRLGVEGHHLGVADDVGATDLVDARRHAPIGDRLDQQLEDVADGNRLASGRDPSRRHHDGEHVHQVAQHLEAGRPGTDHHPRTQLDDFDTGRRQRLADGVAATQVDAEGITITSQAAQVDDAAHSDLGGVTGEVPGVGLLGPSPVRPLPDRMHEVHRNVDTTECLGQVVTDRACRHVDLISPARVIQLCRVPGQAADVTAGSQQGGNEATADVTRSSGDQDLWAYGSKQIFSVHWCPP